MHKKITIIAFLLFLLTSVAQSKENNNNNNNNNNTPESIVIFNLKSKEKSKKYNYYSTIVPHTISKNLNLDKGFIIVRNFQKVDKVKKPKNRRQVDAFINNLKNYGLEENKVDYVIVGECNIIEEIKDNKSKSNKIKEIIITIQIVDVKNKNATNFIDKSTEVGVLFQKTVDRLSKRITTSMVALKKGSFSPAMTKFHKVMSKVNIGMKGGRAFLVGEFNETFKDTVLIGPYVLIHPIKWFGISANFDYFSTKAEKGPQYIDKSLIVYDTYFSLHAIIPIKMFDISISAGLGATFTRIHINDPATPMNPFSYTHFNKERTDYSVNTELIANFNISILRISVGTSYKVIFFKEDQMQIMSVILGLGFRF